MASLGDLVVNLRANTQQFIGGMRKASGVVSDFAVNATLAAGVAGVGGMLKAAADAETLAIKFRVLLKSGKAANAMMVKISDFAAKTPFSKLGIADAAQQLLAFKVPAKDVFARLQQIGDIAAMVRIPMGELAEIFGKANVAGRLFMEDINQIQGRGIAIQDLIMSQFKNTDKTFRELVESGQVNAGHLAKAFEMMTGKGGDFENGMAQMAESTAGKLSTMVDNFHELAIMMGDRLLPIANDVLDTLTAMAQMMGPYSSTILKTVLVLTAMAAAFKLITSVAKTFVVVASMAQAAAGNWGAVAAVVATAAAAWAVVNKVVGQNTEEVKKNAEALKDAEKVLKNLAGGGGGAGGGLQNAGQAFANAAKGGDALTQQLIAMRSPAEQLNIRVREFAAQLREMGGLTVGQQMTLHRIMREQESGFTAMVQSMTDEIRILKGAATETSIALEKMAEMGVAPGRLDQLREMIKQRNQLEKGQEAKKAFEGAMGGIAGIMRQAEAETVAARIESLQSRLEGARRHPGSMVRGSAEAFKTIIGNIRESDPVVEAIKDEIAVLEDVLEELQKKSEFEVMIQGEQ